MRSSSALEAPVFTIVCFLTNLLHHPILYNFAYKIVPAIFEILSLSHRISKNNIHQEKNMQSNFQGAVTHHKLTFSKIAGTIKSAIFCRFNRTLFQTRVTIILKTGAF